MSAADWLATADPRYCSLQTGRSDRALNVSNVATKSMDGAAALGHQLTVATGSFLASHLAMHVRSVTKL
jgi:hypothetical protein